MGKVWVSKFGLLKNPFPIFHQKHVGVGEVAQCYHIPPVALSLALGTLIGPCIKYFGTHFGSLGTNMLVSVMRNARVSCISQREAPMRMECVLVE